MQSLKTQAYRILKKRIVTCEYAPGSFLDEKAIIEELGFSRTPIREALNILSEEGLVDIMPRRAIIVSTISMRDINNLYHLRHLLEPDNARIAAECCDLDTLRNFRGKLTAAKNGDIYTYSELDAELHLYLAECTQNITLVKFMNVLMAQTQRIRILSSDFKERRSDSYQEHMDLIDALLTRDAALAEKIMDKHIIAARNGLDMVFNTFSVK